MENIFNFMAFVGCNAIILLAVWGIWLGIQILIESFKIGHMSGSNALMLMMSFFSIFLAVASISNYLKKMEQLNAQHNAVESMIRQEEKNFDKRMDAVMPNEWKKVE